ncbi:Nif3-like dinuclear metal center hexameric protein [Hyphobacterium sp. CCMP332]|nr:Nif3-like dinuclear metal center hexameric protein [Hyphobacterium sp. CCMP332]
MTKIKDISGSLEEFAPLQLQENYDNAGLIIGNPETEVNAILFCLDSTEEVIEEAIQKKCNLVIAHHPIIFTGLKKIQNQHYVEKTVRKAIKNDIAIYASHTNLDNVYLGVNNKIAEKLDLINTKILRVKEDEMTGAGLIGELRESLNESEFLEKVKKAMSIEVLRHSDFLNRKIKKVALCGGAGSFLIKDAIMENADAFITGDVKYHEFFEANFEILLLDIGHYESERFTIEIFHKVLSGKFPNIALQFSEVNTNPINYST